MHTSRFARTPARVASGIRLGASAGLLFLSCSKWPEASVSPQDGESCLHALTQAGFGDATLGVLAARGPMQGVGIAAILEGAVPSIAWVGRCGDGVPRLWLTPRSAFASVGAASTSSIPDLCNGARAFGNQTLDPALTVMRVVPSADTNPTLVCVLGTSGVARPSLPAANARVSCVTRTGTGMAPVTSEAIVKAIFPTTVNSTQAVQVVSVLLPSKAMLFESRTFIDSSVPATESIPLCPDCSSPADSTSGVSARIEPTTGASRGLVGTFVLPGSEGPETAEFEWNGHDWTVVMSNKNTSGIGGPGDSPASIGEGLHFDLFNRPYVVALGGMPDAVGLRPSVVSLVQNDQKTLYDGNNGISNEVKAVFGVETAQFQRLELAPSATNPRGVALVRAQRKVASGVEEFAVVLAISISARRDLATRALPAFPLVAGFATTQKFQPSTLLTYLAATDFSGGGVTCPGGVVLETSIVK